MNKWFSKLSDVISNWVGSVWAFLLALMVVVAWIFYAIPHRFNSESQMPINSFTTICTFIMVFLIQHTQNKNDKAFHLKINELIRALKEPRNTMIGLEKKTDEEIKEIEKEFDGVE